MTLIEVLVALGLAVVGSFLVLAATEASRGLDAHSRGRTFALSRAQSVLEDLLSTPVDELAARDGELFDVPVELAPGRSAVLSPAPGLARAGSISVTPWGQSNLLLVVVTVRWRSGPTGSAQLELRSITGRR